jgi:hypothetical protein
MVSTTMRIVEAQREKKESTISLVIPFLFQGNTNTPLHKKIKQRDIEAYFRPQAKALYHVEAMSYKTSEVIQQFRP